VIKAAFGPKRESLLEELVCLDTVIVESWFTSITYILVG